MERTKVVDGIREERERFIAYLEGLDDAAWATASLCEGWTVRDVVAHLIGNVSDVLTGRLEDFGSYEYNQRQITERAGASNADLIAEWKDIGPKGDALAGAIPAEAWDVVIPQIGISAGMGMLRLLEDLWIHAHDVRTPLGAAPTKGPGLDAALEVIAHDVRGRLKAFAPTVAAVEFDVEGLKARVEGPGTETVRVTGQGPALVFAGTGRTALADAIATGALAVEPVPEGFATALNIYGTPVPA